VVAAAHNGVVALDWTNAGDAALYPRDSIGQPHQMETGKKVENTQATPY
jgi:hypothetical protein